MDNKETSGLYSDNVDKLRKVWGPPSWPHHTSLLLSLLFLSIAPSPLAVRAQALSQILFLDCKLEIFWGAEDTELWGPTSRDSDLIGSDCNMKPGVRTTDRLWAS